MVERDRDRERERRRRRKWFSDRAIYIPLPFLSLLLNNTHKTPW